MSLLAAFLGSLVATGLLVHIGLALGWIDQRGAQAFRKARRQPVALVGGAAVILGVLIALGLSALDGLTPLATLATELNRLPWPALAVAFLLGLIDDLAPDGLGARVKFSGQLLVAALVAAQPGEAFATASAMECVALGALALVAMNAVNLFDHADGLVGILGAVAMAAGVGPHAGLFAASIAGYLPFNLMLRRSGLEEPADVGEERAEFAPFAMLGDSGSHLIGVLIATTPAAWWFLVIPVVDMLRVSLGRLRRGAPFWRGDRTHVGHRLQGIGFSGLTTAVLVGLTFIPTLVALQLLGGSAPLASGLLAGAALYFAILVMADGVHLDSADLDSADVAGRSQATGSSSSDGHSGGRSRGEERPTEVSVSDVFARASGRAGEDLEAVESGNDGAAGEGGPGGTVLRPAKWSGSDAASGPGGESGAEPGEERANPGEIASGPFANPEPGEPSEGPFLDEDSA